ncbi:MAG TPA: FapA family protein [bacterium]|nr:FapA family protein [bacterium]HPO07057.1 FapA family protein [bacterium]HQO33585.1 FapA family protein [bacterium]HQP99067.1 FapA family protein [bacterium]
MPNSGKDINEAADILKDLLSRIDGEETARSDQESAPRVAHIGTDNEILPEGIDPNSGISVDDICTLTVDKDYIYAVLTISPDRPKDYEVPLDAITQELNRLGIRSGLRKDNLEKAVQLARSNARSRIDLILAQGTKPIDGTDTVLTFHCSMAQGRATVHKGDLLVEKQPGKLPRDGGDILGRVLKAHRGEEFELVPGDGVVTSEDLLCAYAACDGTAYWDAGKLWVNPENRDGHIEVEISADRMSANLSIHPPSGNGKFLAVSDIIPMLFERGIVCGISPVTLLKMAKKVRKTGEPEEGIRIQGVQPEKGRDGRLEILVDYQSKADRYWIKADGSVDFYKLSRIDSVQEGDLLARIIPPSPGQDGYTVTGERIPGPEGESHAVRLGENVVLSENGAEIRAGIAGQIHFEDNTISVRPIYVVGGDVDFSTGNLDFIGDLMVRGNVLDGFDLKAGGNVVVHGTVGSCSIRAEGDVSVGRGVFGRERGLIRAGGDVTVAFLQNATVYSGSDVRMANQILNSRVYAKGKVVVTTGKGSIVGGHIQAGKGVEAKVIGSDFGTKTEIVSGVDWEVEERLVLLHKDLERNRENLEKLDRTIRQFLQAAQNRLENVPPEERRLLEAAVGKRRAIQAELERLEAEQRDTRVKILLPLPADIIATYILHVDVRCTVWDARLRIRKPEKCARVTYDKETERLKVTPYIP